MSRPASVVLRGTGSCLPDRIVRNEDFLSSIDTTDEWIRTRTGIRERRFASPDESSASLGIIASQRAIEQAGLTPADIDLIICATITPDLMCPSTANLIQTGLRCGQVPSFDILAACTGYLYAMSIAEQYIRNGAAKNVLVVGAEVVSRVTDFTDRNTCILFGDGAGAAVLSASDEPETGLRYSRLYSDAEKQHLIQVPGRVTTPSADGTTVRYLQMNGREVFRFAVSTLIGLMQDALREAEKLGTTISLVIPHQVNQRIIDSAMEHTSFPVDRVVVNLDRYGNTSAASVPMALDEALRQGRAATGDTILLVAFGGGLTWGSMLLTL